MAGRRRGWETVGDMVRSLALVLAAVAVVLLITFRPSGQEVRLVDWSGTLAQARVGAPYALVAPVGLPSDWRPTSVYFDPSGATGAGAPTNWHVGFVTPSNQYAAFEQTNGPAQVMLTSVLSNPRAGTAASVAGTTWQRYDDDGSNRHALVRTQGGVTVVVDGSAGWPELERLASVLQPQPPVKD